MVFVFIISVPFLRLVIPYRELQGLFLDRLLELDVGLVSDVQGHFQFGDLELELLLDAGNFGFEFGLGFNQTVGELLDLDGSLFAEGENWKGTHE